MGSKAEQIANNFLVHRDITQEVLRRIPDDRAGFQPWDGAYTVCELASHMAAAYHMFVEIAIGRGVIVPDRGAWPKDLPGVRQFVKEMTERDMALVREISDDGLATAAIGAFDRVLPARLWLGFGRDHEIHHKGQLMLYARMCGADVPLFFVQA